MALQIFLAEVQGVKGDIFCEVRLKDTVHAFKTLLQRRCVNPKWDERWFVFQNELGHKAQQGGFITVKVYACGLFGNTVLGAVQIPLHHVLSRGETNCWYQLLQDDKVHARPTHGRVRVESRYAVPEILRDAVLSGSDATPVMPARGTPLTVEVVEAKCATGDLFVEVRLKGQCGKGTTSVVPSNGRALWNHAFSYKNWKDPNADILQVKVYSRGPLRTLGHRLVGAVAIPVSLALAHPLDGWFDLWHDLLNRGLNGMSVHLRIYWGPPGASRLAAPASAPRALAPSQQQAPPQNAAPPRTQPCPVCSKLFSPQLLETHANACLEGRGDEFPSDVPQQQEQLPVSEPSAPGADRGEPQSCPVCSKEGFSPEQLEAHVNACLDGRGDEFPPAIDGAPTVAAPHEAGPMYPSLQTAPDQEQVLLFPPSSELAPPSGVESLPPAFNPQVFPEQSSAPFAVPAVYLAPALDPDGAPRRLPDLPGFPS